MEEEEEEELSNKNPSNSNPTPAPVSNNIKELPKFDMSEFSNLQNVGSDVKELLSIMAK